MVSSSLCPKRDIKPSMETAFNRLANSSRYARSAARGKDDEPGGPAQPGMQAGKLLKPDHPHTFHDIGFNKTRLRLSTWRSDSHSNINRRMRPG
jgi:hypothetical protein